MNVFSPIFFFIAVLLLNEDCGAENRPLLQNLRSFVNYVDEAKLSSYLASFAANPSPAAAQRHVIIKRASPNEKTSKRKVRKVRKIVTTSETPIESKPEEIEIQFQPQSGIDLNFQHEELSSAAETTTKRSRRTHRRGSTRTAAKVEKPPTEDIPRPRERPSKKASLKLTPPKQESSRDFDSSSKHIVKFELDDAKYSEEYERLKKGRKQRVKRASGDEQSKVNVTKQAGDNSKKSAFIQPRELFRFSFEDAVKSPKAARSEESNEKKSKRETIDAIAAESSNKNVHSTNALRGARSTMHVSYDEISPKLQKIIDSALSDAVKRGKATDGDYLKFFYGDKIIKVPVSMSKYVLNKPKEEPVSTIYGKHEETTVEKPQILGTKKTYYPIKESVRHFPINFVTTEKVAEPYSDFKNPIVVQPDNLPPKKSIFFYSDEDQNYAKNHISSPGPVLFDSTTPSNIETTTAYKTFIFHPPTEPNIIYGDKYDFNSAVKDSTPITEDVDESFSYIPLVPHKSHAPISVPTSYVEYAENHNGYYDYAKSYEFGYHVSDYKTGNNFGHMQKSNPANTKGEYSTLLPDGRVQIVKYFADDSGFHADVSYQTVH